MLPITKNFIIKVHQIFDELGYHLMSSNVNIDDFQDATINTINHCKELEDCREAINMYRFIIKKFKKVCSKIKKHYDFWKTLPYEGNESISLISDEETDGIYIITNGFSKNYKEGFLFSHAIGDDDCAYITYEHGMFNINEEVIDYYLRFSKSSSAKLILLDSEKNKKCIIKYKSIYDMTLENNNTNYELVLYNDGNYGIYKKSYIDSLTGKEPDDQEMCAFIEWDILNKNGEQGLARLFLYNNEDDFQLFVLLALSFMLLFRSYKVRSRMLMMTSFMTSQNLSR